MIITGLLRTWSVPTRAVCYERTPFLTYCTVFCS